MRQLLAGHGTRDGAVHHERDKVAVPVRVALLVASVRGKRPLRHEREFGEDRGMPLHNVLL